MNPWPLSFRYAVRTLAKAPGFTALAVGTLALGIGANSAIFSLLYGVLFKPLPFPQPQELVRVHSQYKEQLSTVSPPDFADWRRTSTAFTRLAASNAGFWALSGNGAAESVAGRAVTTGYFELFGAVPLAGRTFVTAEEAVGQDRVVVLGEGLWHRRFGGRPDVLGQTVTVDGEPFTVVGVVADDFDGRGDTQLWRPLAFTSEELTTQRGAHYLSVHARLRPGVTIEQADREMQLLAARLATEYPSTNEGMTTRVVDLRESIVGDVRPALLALFGAVGLVLLIACVNVAHLLLTRALARRHQLAVRTALGARSFQLLRELAAESLILSFLGGGVGLVMAAWAVDLFAGLELGDLPRLAEVEVSGGVLAFTAGLSLATSLLFGVAPAFAMASRRHLAGAMGGGSGSKGGERRLQPARNALVVAEIALALVLVTGAGLLGKSLLRLTATDPGFDADGVLTMEVSLPEARYQEPERIATFYEDLLVRLRNVPGVLSAGAVFGLPMNDFNYSISLYELDGRLLSDDEQSRLASQIRVVTPGYFETLRIPLSRGRSITAVDRAGAPPVMVVNEAAARLIWPGEDPVGRKLTIGTGFGLGRGRAGGEVVGVVGDVRDVAMGTPPRPQIYLAHHQFPMDFLAVALRVEGDPLALASTVRAELGALDPEVPAFRLGALAELTRRSMASSRFYALLLALFAGLALVLAAIGIYGVTAYGVAERSREIGIRMAMGARLGDVLRLVVRQGACLALGGVALGLAASWAATRLVEKMLYSVDPLDPATFVVMPVFLMVVALAACYLPARSAATLDPAAVLKRE